MWRAARKRNERREEERTRRIEVLNRVIEASSGCSSIVMEGGRASSFPIHGRGIFTVGSSWAYG